MANRRFYTDVYFGEEIPEKHFGQIMKRAESYVRNLKTDFGAKPKVGIGNPATAFGLSECAVAEAMYDFWIQDCYHGDYERAARGEEPYRKSPEKHIAHEVAERNDLFLKEAGYYLKIRRA